jgi:uncharacterized protein with HEPN domain
MKREIGDFIEDIINAMNKALKFVAGVSYEEFAKDDKTIFAVIRAIEIIGEAVKNIPEDTKKEYPAIPWKGMAGMRDKVIHGYSGVDIKVVWDTVKKRIPEVKLLFEKMLKDLEERE